MKKFRKLMAMVTALAMAGCMMTAMSVMNVSADTYSITIRGFGGVDGEDGSSNDDGVHIYTAYQIFSGDYSDGVLSSVRWNETNVDYTALVDALKLDTVFGEGELNLFYSVNISTTDKGAEKVAEILGSKTKTSNEEGNEVEVSVFEDDGALAQEFAKLVGENLLSSATGTNSTSTDDTITISGLSNGYYFIKENSSPTAPTDDSSYDNTGAKTRYILRVVGQNVDIYAKSSAPSVIKKVKENTKVVNESGTAIDGVFKVDAQYNDVADYNIGDNVPFKLYGSMPNTIADYKAYRYIFHDTLDAQFDAPTKVTVQVDNNTAVEITLTGGTGTSTVGNSNIIVSTKAITENVDGETVTTGTSIDVNIVNILGLGYDVTKNTIVTVSYDAVLNENAEIGLPGQQNDVYLEYSSNPNWSGKGENGGDTPDTPGGEDNDDNDETNETPKDNVIVFTYELDVNKVNADSERLANAEFVLSKKITTESEEKTVYAQISNESGAIIGSANAVSAIDTSITWVDSQDNATVLKSSDVGENNIGGNFTIKGLDDGVYYLTETKAPAGYNKLTSDVKLEISATTNNGQTGVGDDDGKDALTALKLKVNDVVVKDVDGNEKSFDLDKGIVQADIINQAGSSLPSTGGIGTTIFYMVGGVLVVGAGVTLITKKRMKNNEQ